MKQRNALSEFLTNCDYHNSKRISIFIVFLFLIPLLSVVHAQPAGTARIGFKVEFSNHSIKAGDTLEVIFYAKVPAGYHLYSEKSDCPSDDGPIRAEWKFDATEGVLFVGPPTGVGDHLNKDEVFKCATGEFTDNCEFHQKIVWNGGSTTFIAHFVGQQCSITDGECSLIAENVTVNLPIAK